ncbi:MAG: cytochrome c [Gammaproteobacteria bacterium]
MLRLHHWRAPRAFAALALGAVAACQAPPAGPVTPAPTAQQMPAQTVHHSARLRELMQRMNAMLYERNQTELEIDKQRLDRARELAAAAATLAHEASVIGPPGAADASAREDFTHHAHALANAAAELDALAAARRYSELSPQMERVAHVCADCHLRFRVRAP